MRRIEAPTVRSLSSPPMCAITPDMMSALRHLGCSAVYHTVTEAFRAASLRLAVRSDVLDAIRASILVADDSDAALLAPRDLDWMASCPLAFSMSLREAARALPSAMVAHPRPEAFIRRHDAPSDAPVVARAWMRRRLGHLLSALVVDGEVDLASGGSFGISLSSSRLPRLSSSAMLAALRAGCLGSPWAACLGAWR